MRNLFGVVILFLSETDSLTDPAGDDAGTDEEIDIVADYAPEQSDDERHACGVDEVAVVGGEQPFADARASGRKSQQC